ncbi:MAG: hypothetical protein J3K34DRAFT_521185 [Monoraphidium minutum]|nr:MAG: hypothetical protein J3K34DRAFT_521185 [Monoraphidium minutum]
MRCLRSARPHTRPKAERSGRGGSSGVTRGAPRLTALSEAELDAIVCALEHGERRDLHLACRRLSRAVNARIPLIVICPCVPLGPPPELLPPALPRLAARFPRATCVRVAPTPARLKPGRAAAAGAAGGGSALAAALRALPVGAWPGVTDVEAPLRSNQQEGEPILSGPLLPADLPELARVCPRLSTARMCPRLSAARGLLVTPRGAWGGGAPPAALAELTRLEAGLSLHFEIHGDFGLVAQAAAVAEAAVLDAAVTSVLSALPGLVELRLQDLQGGRGGGAAFSGAWLNGAPLGRLTLLELQGYSDECASLSGGDLAAIAAACPLLRDLSSVAITPGPTPGLAGARLPHLTRLNCEGVPRAGALQRVWAPALHSLEVQGTHDGLWPDDSVGDAVAPHYALQRIAFRGAGRGAAEGSWMRGAAAPTRLTELELAFCGGGYGDPWDDADSEGGDGGGEEGGGGGADASSPEQEGLAFISRLAKWAGRWPQLRSLALDAIGMRVPAASVLGALRGAPLAASLTQLRLGGVALGDEGAAGRVLECLPAIPHLETLNLRVRASRAYAPAGALRAAAELAAATRAPAKGGARPRVALSLPEAWLWTAGPLALPQWAVLVEGHPLMSVYCVPRHVQDELDGDSLASESLSGSDDGSDGSGDCGDDGDGANPDVSGGESDGGDPGAGSGSGDGDSPQVSGGENGEAGGGARFGARDPIVDGWSDEEDGGDDFDDSDDGSGDYGSAPDDGSSGSGDVGGSGDDGYGSGSD